MTAVNRDRKTRVITVANRKGGVGKTTTTLSVGTVLAQRGHKVLLLDLDPQGNLTLALGFQPHEMPPPSKNMPTAGTIFADDTYATENKNLDLVFAHSLIIDNDYQVQVNTGDDMYFLSQDLEVILHLPYDYVLIDCPPTIGKVMTSALLISNFLIIPTQVDFYSAYALKDMMELVSEVRREGNPALPYRILITLFDKFNRTHHGIKNQLSRTFVGGIFKTIIEADTELRKTAILGFPAETTRGVRQYRKLVDELLEYLKLPYYR